MFLWSPPSTNPCSILNMHSQIKCTDTNKLISPSSFVLNIQTSRVTVQISPDSRSSELERRSRSNDMDLSLSFPLATLGEAERSLSSKSAPSTLSFLHPSAARSRHLSWDGDSSLSRVWDDLSLEDLKEKRKRKENESHPLQQKAHQCVLLGKSNNSEVEGKGWMASLFF